MLLYKWFYIVVKRIISFKGEGYFFYTYGNSVLLFGQTRSIL